MIDGTRIELGTNTMLQAAFFDTDSAVNAVACVLEDFPGHQASADIATAGQLLSQARQLLDAHVMRARLAPPA